MNLRPVKRIVTCHLWHILADLILLEVIASNIAGSDEKQCEYEYRLEHVPILQWFTEGKLNCFQFVL